MKKIVYSSHLKFRISLRQIPYTLPRYIFKTAKEHYFDTATNKNIAVAEAKYKDRMRQIVIVYEEYDSRIVIVTIHPLKSAQKFNRIKSGRWQTL